MTATAEAAETEFQEWYGLTTVLIPPHRPCIRMDYPDRVYHMRREKNRGLIDEIATVHATGRPILVGTRTVRDSRELAEGLASSGVECRILNAEDNACEAAIVARAGAFGAVTISTNMAGRGTDIRLGGEDGKDRERVAALGGLYVIGTNRFESRRIDDQLRGRAGRQGDPGSSRFFISLEDDLFVKYRIRELIPEKQIVTDGEGIVENAYVNNEVNRLQRIIEGQNSDIKRTLGRYSVLMEQQREIVSEHRAGVLAASGIPEELSTMPPALMSAVKSIPRPESGAALCRRILLEAIDRSWSSYLADMADVRDGIHFRKFGMQNPIHAFNTLAIERFEAVLPEAYKTAVERIERLTLDRSQGPHPADAETPKPSATWTYLVSDNPFEDNPDLQMSGNMGYSVFAGLLWPLTMLMLLLKRMRKKK
jgi:preprotein translocase subunit SecA